MRKPGRELERDESVHAFRRVVDVAQDVRRVLNVPDGKIPEQLFRVGGAAVQRIAQPAIVVAAPRNRVLEDARVGCHTRDGKFVDVLAEPATVEQRTPDVVIPDALPELMKSAQPLVHQSSTIKGNQDRRIRSRRQ